MGTLKNKIKRYSLLILAFHIQIFVSNYADQPIKGGVCFRVDDNKPLSKFMEYSSIFDSYSQKFTFALNLDLINNNVQYIEGIRALQARGHELMDHTPSHSTNHFNTILSTDYFQNHPGVHSISGNKVKLKHAEVDIDDATRSGYVDIKGNIVTSNNGSFAEFSKHECYLYFSDLNKLVLINDYSNSWIDDHTVRVTDIWGGGIDLGVHENIQYYNFHVYKVHLTLPAIKALGEESIRLSEHYNIDRPYSWIQPGGYHPMISRGELKQALGDELDYKSAGSYPGPSFKVFNEHNPNNDKQYGMNWGDFRDDTWTLEECKNYIADLTAKHHMVIGHNHFSGLLGNWEGFLKRTDDLIRWCVNNDIPIRTYSQWADILYDQKAESHQNIFPSLSIDKDKNNYPDGYSRRFRTSSAWIDIEGKWIKDDGVGESNNHSFSISKEGNICYIGRKYRYLSDGLGGLSKGENEFEIWTKGAPGNIIDVEFRVGKEKLVFRFPAESSEWKKYELQNSLNGIKSLVIPEDVSTIDVLISCSSYNGGEVRISGMSLSKKNQQINIPPTITTSPVTSGEVGILYVYDVNTSGYPSPDCRLIEAPGGMSIDYATGIINWIPESIGTYNVTVKATNGINPDALQSFSINVSEGNGDDTGDGNGIAYLNVPSSLNLPSSSGSTVVIVESNVSWLVKDNTGSGSSGWINKSPKTGNGNSTVQVKFKENTSSSSRTGSLIFTGGSMTKTVSITQAGKSSGGGNTNLLSVSPSSGNVRSSSGIIKLDVLSNVSWTASSNAPWLTLNPKSGSNNGSITALYIANLGSISRTATITVSGGGLSSSTTITQSGKSNAGGDGYINIPTTLTLPRSSGSLTVMVESNVLWTVRDNTGSGGSGWISKSPKTGNGNGKITIRFKTNDSKDSRSGQLIFNGNGITKIIEVVQDGSSSPGILDGDGEKYLTVPDELNLPGNSGKITIEVKSNINWTVRDNTGLGTSGWISKSPKSGSGDGNVEVRYYANTTGNPRSGELTFYGEGIVKIVQVKQSVAGALAKGSSREEDFETEEVEEIPTEYSLSNYPNPFNPITSIKFALPEGGYTELYISNSIGELVNKLISDYKSEGVYDMKFNASKLASGVYFYTLRSGKFVQTKKMLLLE